MSFKNIGGGSSLEGIVNDINQNIFELKNREVTQIFKDDTGARRVLLGKGADGFYGIKVSKANKDVYDVSDDDLLFSSSFDNESHILMHYWFGSYKTSASYTNLNGSYTVINFDDWKGRDWYFESTIFTDSGTGYVQLYNVTDGAAVAGTEFTTTAVGEANAEYYRSAALTKPTGTKVFRVQVKKVGGGADSVNAMKSSMVFRTGA
jgi:hypothetical protein